MSDMKQDAKPRKTAAKALAGFMVLMALLTLGSRTLENIAMAEVVVTRSTGGTLDRVLNTNASVRASGDQSIKVLDALPVASVLVNQGDKIAAGQAILTLDVAPLEEKLEQAKLDLIKKRLDLESARLEAPGTTPEETLREAMRAHQETGEQVSEAEIQAGLALVKAEEALSDAKIMLQRVLDKAWPAAQESLSDAKQTRNDSINEAAQAYDKAVKALQRLTDPNSGDLAKEKAEAYEAYEAALEAHNEATEGLTKALVRASEALTATTAELNVWNGYLPPGGSIPTGETEATVRAKIAELQIVQRDQSEALTQAQKNYEKGDAAGSKTVNKLWEEYQALANPNSEGTAERIAAAQKAVTDTKKAYDKIVKDQDRALAAVQLSYDMTKQAVELHKAGTLESGMWDMPADIEGAITQVEGSQKGLEDAQKSREKTLKDNNRTLEQADKTLSDVKKQVNYQSQADRIADENKRLSLLAAEQEITKQEESITRLQQLQDDGGKIISPVDGTIAELSVKSGDVLTENAIVAKIAAGDESMELVATVSANDVKQLKTGIYAEMYASNMWASGTVKGIKKATTEGMPSNSQTYEVTFSIDGGNPFQIGDSVQVTIRQTSQRYYTIIPISSLREDSKGKFVFILEEQSGALGTKQIVRRVDVTVQESNETQAAVNGSLSDWDKLIERGDRPLNDGDRVRIKQ